MKQYIFASLLVLALLFAGCSQKGECPQDYQPVCGNDGITYSNSCFAQLAGTLVAHEGECSAVAATVPATPTELPSTQSTSPEPAPPAAPEPTQNTEEPAAPGAEAPAAVNPVPYAPSSCEETHRTFKLEDVRHVIASTQDPVTLYVDEELDIEGGVIFELEAIAGTTLHFDSYQNYADYEEERNVCQGTANLGETKQSNCHGGFTVGVSSVTPNFAELSFNQLNLAQYSDSEGVQTTYTGTNCPAPVKIYTEFSAEFYPPIATTGTPSYLSKEFKLFDESATITGANPAKKSLSITLKDVPYELTDGGTLVYQGKTYYVDISTEHNGIDEIELDEEKDD